MGTAAFLDEVQFSSKLKEINFCNNRLEYNWIGNQGIFYYGV